jgi:mRNA interferase RelE/StbE
MYKISLTRRAEKDLRSLNRSMKNRTVTAISELANDPRPSGCRKIQSEEGVWRIRIGDWRVGYTINDKSREVIVIRIVHRKEFYD